jgi:hypothetical protein
MLQDLDGPQLAAFDARLAKAGAPTPSDMRSRRAESDACYGALVRAFACGEIAPEGLQQTLVTPFYGIAAWLSLHLMQRCAGDSSDAPTAVRRDRFPSTIVNSSVRSRGFP